MNSCSNAFIIFKSRYRERVVSALNKISQNFVELSNVSCSPPLTCHLLSVVKFDNVFFGNLINESVTLIEANIPHSIFWLSGEGYEKGSLHYRTNSDGRIVFIKSLDLSEDHNFKIEYEQLLKFLCSLT